MSGQGTEGFMSLGDVDVLETLGVKDFVQGLTRRGKLWMFNQLFGDNWWAGLFDIVAEADWSKDVTVSPSGIVNVIRDYMYRTVDIGAIVGEEIGSESVMEMMSEGLSSALETNFNASLQTILNVWKGGLPPDLSFAMQLGSNIDRTETMYALSILAPVGHLPYVILSALREGAMNRLDAKYSNIQEFYANLLMQKFNAVSADLNAYLALLEDVLTNTIRDCTNFIERLENFIVNVCNETLARVNQLEDDLEANKIRYDNGIIGSDEYEKRLLEIDADVDATQTVFDEYISEVTNQITEYVNTLDSIKNDVVIVIQEYMDLVENYVKTLTDDYANTVNTLADISEMKNKIMSLYNKIKAYRKTGFAYS